VQLLDAEQVEGGGHADRVDHGVQSADLVQVDPVGVDAVDAGLHLGDLAHRARRDRHVGDAREQLGRGPLGGLVGDVDDRAGRPDPTPRHALGAQVPPVEPGAGYGGLHVVEGRAEVQQGAQQHVAGDPADRVEPEDHRATRSAIRCAASAAAKPESMFTTTTPAAHELSIASSGVTPSSTAPYPTDVGTAITGQPTSPPTTLGSAPSMPATQITASAAASRSCSASNRCTPATPTSRSSSTCSPIAVATA